MHTQRSTIGYWSTAAALLLLSAGGPCRGASTHPLSPLPTWAARHIAPPTDPVHFMFLVGGDNRAAGRGVPAPPTAQQIFMEARVIGPALILWTGDAIYGSEASAEYDQFLATAALSGAPVYNAPGNHEIYDRPEMAALYQEKMGPLFGSFDYGNSHFIALDTEEPDAPGGISDAQIEWLKADLEANKGATNKFVFMHHPLFPKVKKEGVADADRVATLHGLFVQYGVKNVISGHEHLLYHSDHDGITYWVTGGSGAPTDASPEDGGYQHYLLFTVDGTTVQTVVVQPWRIFASTRRAASGAVTAMLVNYNDCELILQAEIPITNQAGHYHAVASWTYKGKTHKLTAQAVPSANPGVVVYRTVVPAHRAAIIDVSTGD